MKEKTSGSVFSNPGFFYETSRQNNLDLEFPSRDWQNNLGSPPRDWPTYTVLLIFITDIAGHYGIVWFLPTALAPVLGPIFSALLAVSALL